MNDAPPPASASDPAASGEGATSTDLAAAQRRARWVVMALHQVMWFVTVWRVSAGAPAQGALAMGRFVLFALGVLPRRELLVLVVSATVLGFFVDTSLVLLGFIASPAPVELVTASPLWMVALWAGFGVALALPLQWMIERPLLGIVVGAVAGPLAYRGGVALDAIALPRGTGSLVAIAVGWAFAMGVMQLLFRGFARPSR